MKSRIFASVFSGVFLMVMISGCAHTRPGKTPRKVPEVTIANCTQEELADALAYLMVNAGYKAKLTHAHMAVFFLVSTEYFNQAGYDPYYTPGSPIEQRVTYTFKETLDGIRVRCFYAVYTNPNSPLEREWDQMNDDTYHETQFDLEQLKREIERSNRRSIGILINYNGVITEIKKRGSADIAGLRVGDMILKIDGQDVTDCNSSMKRSMIMGLVGTDVEITVDRNGEEMTFKVHRE